MLISYLRSSSYNCHDFCAHQYLLDYVLGIKPEPNKKTVLGSIVHKVLELVGRAKIQEQNNEINYRDGIAGEVAIHRGDVTEVVDIHGIVNRVYKDFCKKYTQFDWSIEDFNDCLKWTIKVLEDTNFSPLNRKIISVEKKFDFEVNKLWSKFRYEPYELPPWIKGPLEGNLAIKGTIDLLTEVKDKVIEVIDWKTGRRFDWGKKEVKDYHKLLNDPQLRIYHYVLSYLYPEIDQIIITIYYINDGGAYTIPFTKKDMIKTEGMIKDKFYHIKRTVKPRLSKGWHCSKFCYFGRYNMNRKRTTDENNTICAHIHREIQKKGMNQVVQDYTTKGYSLDTYQQGE